MLAMSNGLYAVHVGRRTTASLVVMQPELYSLFFSQELEETL